MRYKAKILHRDLSINNIMWEIRDGRYRFILIDFDMAIRVEDERGNSTYQTSSKHRTGTLPFMSFELILDAVERMASKSGDWKDLAHLLRHDYESLFYVSYWSITAFPDSEDPHDKSMLANFAKAMELGGLEALGNAKSQLLTAPLKKRLLEASPAGKGLKTWFTGFSTIFSEATSGIINYKLKLDDVESGYRTVASLPPFDLETAGGFLTRDSIKAELTPRIPEKCWTSVRVQPSNGTPANPPVDTVARSITTPTDPAAETAATKHVAAKTATTTIAAATASTSKAAATKAAAPAKGQRTKRIKAAATTNDDPPAKKDKDLPARRRAVRKQRMTAQEAMDAQNYVKTRLRARK